MADVTNSRRRDRAQLLIITGLVIAITLVALTLLLNTAIYSDNLAARGTGFGGDDALEVHATAEAAIEDLIDEETDQEHATYADLNATVMEAIETYGETRALAAAHRGVSVWVSNATLEEGERLRQTNPDRNFTNASEASDWTLAENVDETRQFVLEITDVDGLEDESEFAVVLNDSVSEWRVLVYEDGAGNTTIAVQNGTDESPTRGVCDVSNEPVIDLTGGTVDGEPCSALVWANEINTTYSIAYEHGVNATGTYNLTINTGGAAESVEGNFGTGPDEPYTIPAVYSATFDVGYESRVLEYRATVRVASGEP